MWLQQGSCSTCMHSAVFSGHSWQCGTAPALTLDAASAEIIAQQPVNCTLLAIHSQPPVPGVCCLFVFCCVQSDPNMQRLMTTMADPEYKSKVRTAQSLKHQHLSWHSNCDSDQQHSTPARQWAQHMTHGAIGQHSAANYTRPLSVSLYPVELVHANSASKYTGVTKSIVHS